MFEPMIEDICADMLYNAAAIVRVRTLFELREFHPA
jgi:hypothetical protein